MKRPALIPIEETLLWYKNRVLVILSQHNKTKIYRGNLPNSRKEKTTPKFYINSRFTAQLIDESNFYPFRLTLIESSPLNKKSNSLLIYKNSQLLLTLTTKEVKPTSCLQFSQPLSQEVKPTSCYNSLKNQLPRSQTHFFYKSRNYYNSIINLEQINKD